MSTYTFKAVDLVSKFGFNDGDIPDDLGEILYDAHRPRVPGQTWKAYDDARTYWQPRVLVPLLRGTLVPALPFPVEVPRWADNTSTHNPVRAEAVDGMDLMANTLLACESLLRPHVLTVPLAFLIDASLRVTPATLLAGIPLRMLTMAAAAGLSATEIATRYRAGTLTDDTVGDLEILAGLRS